jgi:hypothetical protein
MLLTTAILSFAPVLPAPQEPPSAVAYLPEDTLIAFSASREPWTRLGEGTRLHQVLGVQGVEDALAPMIEATSEFDRETTSGAGAALWNALAYSRMWLAMPVSGLDEGHAAMAVEMGPGAVLELDQLFPDATTLTVRGVEVRVAEGFGVFCRDGDVVAGMIDLGGLTADTASAAAEELAARVLSARSGGAGLDDLSGMNRLREHFEGGDDLIGVWVPAEALDMDRLRAAFPEEARDFDEAERFLELMGLSDFGGFAWTVSIDGRDLRDRTAVLLPGFGGPVWSGELLAAADLPGRAAALPADTSVARLVALDFGAMVSEFFRLAEGLAGMEGQVWPPEGLGEMLVTAQRIASALGPVAGMTVRQDDLWNALEDGDLMLGDIWVDIQEPTALDAAVQELPAPVLDLLRQGFHFGGKDFAYAVRGDRLMVSESAAEPVEGRLADSPAFHRALQVYAEELAQGGIALIDYGGPEMVAAQVQRVRDQAADMGPMPDGLPRLDALPGFDELVGALGPSVGIWQITGDGVVVDYRTSLGYSFTTLLGSSTDLLMGLGEWSEAVEREVRLEEEVEQVQDF